MKMIALSTCVLSLLSMPALAEDDWEAERATEAHKQSMKSLEKDLPVTPPEPGLETAPVQAPFWCKGGESSGATVSSIVRTIESARRYANYWPQYLDAAEILCNWPKEPAIHKAVQVILQSWINLTGQSVKDATETFKARYQKPAFAAAKKQLCDALTVSDEIEGEAKAYMAARRLLFGCGSDDPLWAEYAGGTKLDDNLVTWLDGSTTSDDLIPLAIVLDRSKLALREQGTYFEKELATTYVINQLDFKALAPDRVMKMLDSEPYKDNVYARVILLESMGRARMQMAGLDEIVKKKTSDDGWKELLVTAPQRGIANWNKATEQWKAEIARSNELENKFWGPSRKALKGCWPAQRADFVKVMKSLKFTSPEELKGALTDPIASLIMSRMAACAAVDTDKHLAGKLLAMARDLPLSRGPRLAAYNEAVAALSEIVADRTKFPIQPKDLYLFSSRALYDEALGANNKNPTGKYDEMGFVMGETTAIVKSVKKKGDLVVVTFVTEAHQEMEQTCVETNKFGGFDTAGRPYYRQKCKATGKYFTVDTTPDPITMPTEWADGIKKGSLVLFDAARGKGERMGLPMAVWSDKSKKKFVNWYGFGL